MIRSIRLLLARHVGLTLPDCLNPVCPFLTSDAETVHNAHASVNNHVILIYAVVSRPIFLNMNDMTMKWMRIKLTYKRDGGINFGKQEKPEKSGLCPPQIPLPWYQD